MTTVSAAQTSTLPAVASLLKTQQAVPARTQTDPLVQANDKAGIVPPLSFPPPAGSANPVPPGRFENPGRQQGVLEFGPATQVSALTRNYTATGKLVPEAPSAVNLFAQPARGINYLA